MAEDEERHVLYECDDKAVCQLVHVGKSESKSDSKNAKTLYRKIRVQVLDCRSGDPVRRAVVEGIKINTKLIRRFIATGDDVEWDISRHFPLHEKKGWWTYGWRNGKDKVVPNANNTLKGLGAASQIALEALGFDPGKPISESYGPQDKTAYLKYLMTHGYIETPSPEDEAPTFTDQMKWATELLELEWRLLVYNDSLTRKEFDNDYLKQYHNLDGSKIRVVPNEKEMREIIGDYNVRCFRAMKFHLASKGYYPENKDPLADCAMDETDSDEEDKKMWKDSWKEQFHDWQKVESDSPPKSPWDFVKTKDVGRRLMESSRYVTNDHGIIWIPIPVTLFENKITLEIKFRDFAVAPEATKKDTDIDEKQNGTGIIHRQLLARGISTLFGLIGDKKPVPGATGFSIEWEPTQTQKPNEWDQNWGWRLGPGRSNNDLPREKFAQFKTSAEFTIHPPEDKDDTGDLWKLHEDKGTFSMFYDKDKDHAEFVVFALQWCQPVWDGIDDPPPDSERDTINKKSFVFRNGNPNISNMHIVTMWTNLGGTLNHGKKYGGKGYGFYEWSADPIWRSKDDPDDAKGGHAGMDVHATKGSNVFAVHGGKAEVYSKGNNTHHIVSLYWGGAKKTRYLHNQQHVLPLTLSAAGVRIRARVGVKAGQKIVESGREGNFEPKYPSHVHMDRVGFNGSLSDGPEDELNKMCLPKNWRTPLLFPCVCEVESTDFTNPKNCNFDKTSNANWKYFVNDCWAVGELKCPYMPQEISVADIEGASAKFNAKLRLQAQLRYLYENKGAPYLNPGILDGDIPEVDMVSIKANVATIRKNPAGSDADKYVPNITKNKGTKLPYLGKNGDYYKVKVGEKIGYVHNSVSTWGGNSSTRKAIEAFRVETEGDEVPGEPKCSKVTDDVIKRLNHEDYAPITEPE